MPSQFDLIVKLLDVASLREQVIGHNVANANTPGYHRREVAFEEELQSALEGGGPVSWSELAPRQVEMNDLPARADGNNVDIELEMGALSKNALLYETYSQILATKLGMLRSAISGQA